MSPVVLNLPVRCVRHDQQKTFLQRGFEVLFIKRNVEHSQNARV